MTSGWGGEETSAMNCKDWVTWECSGLPYEEAVASLHKLAGLSISKYAAEDITRRWGKTEMGLLEGVRVPRSRRGTYQPAVFARYQRRQPRVNQLILEMFVAGVATRRVGEVLEALLGECPSATTVSRIAKGLDARVKQFPACPLPDRWRFLRMWRAACARKISPR